MPFLSLNSPIHLHLSIDLTFFAILTQDGDYGSMLEKFTEGRSGSFFYFTHDYKYIVKTVTAAECQLLQTILPQYVAYLRSSPTSFLTRFLGLHAIRMSPEQAKISFVVMGNIFAVGQNVGTVRLDEIYDLKGSVVHRFPVFSFYVVELLAGVLHWPSLSPLHTRRRSLKNGMTPKSFKGTMKDMDLTRKLRVGPVQVRMFLFDSPVETMIAVILIEIQPNQSP
eukprot:m.831916 g.831916  ORF g.831916 m.831916 type:complete len:224 (+) comp59456_c0_seq55:2761-3432(+)